MKYITYLLQGSVILVIGMVLWKAISSIILLVKNAEQRKNAILLKIMPQKTSDITKTEQFFSFLHGFLLNTQWRALTGGRPYMGYEIVAKHKKIEFFIWIDKRYKKTLEEQIYICYPDCIVKEAEEHMVPLKVANRKVRELKRKKKAGKFEGTVRKLQIHGLRVKLGLSYIFPIADKMDIADSILGAMTDLEWHEKLVLQILVRPIDRRWQVRGRRLARNYEKKGMQPGSIGSGFSREVMSLKDQFANEISGEIGGVASNSFKRKAPEHTRTDREEIREAATKVLKSGFETEIRVLGTGFYGRGIIDRIRAVSSSFNKADYINRFSKKRVLNPNKFYRDVQRRHMSITETTNILTPGELAGFVLRMPEQSLSIREIERNRLIQLPPPIVEFEKIRNLIGNISYKGSETPFGLKPQDARRHTHVIGGIGVGKSEFLKRQFLDAVTAGKGAILMDPHGELSDDILKLLVQMLPEERLKDILWYDFGDSEYPVPFNFMKIYFESNSSVSRADIIDETAEEFMNIMKQIFSDSWGIRTEKIFRHMGKALMEAGEGGLWNAKQMLKSRDYRKKVVSKVRNVAVKDFWTTEFVEKQTANGGYKLDSEMRNAIDSPLTKIDRFLSSERIFNMVGQEECINFKECINGNKIVIFRIPKGTLKEDNTKFIGNIVFSKLMMAFMARKPEEMKNEKLLLVDEVQNFVTTNPKSFEMLLDELRKYGVQFVMAHQRVSQIEQIISAVMDNVGTTVCFRVGVESSKYMQRVYGKFLEASDLEQLENRYAYCRALVNGQKTDPFLIKTLDRYEVDMEKAAENVEKVVQLNRESRKPKEEIEKELKKRLKEAGAEESEMDFKIEVDQDFMKAKATASTNEYGGLPEEWD